MKKAKDLAGNYANLRPDNPERFFASLAGVLEQYPVGLVDECICPVRGIAKRVEFLSIKALTEWLDTRLEYYKSFALHVPIALPAPRKFTKAQEERGMAGVRGLIRCLKEGRDVKALSVDEIVALGSEAPCPT